MTIVRKDGVYCVEGYKLQSVTTVINSIKPKDQFDGWYKKLAKEVLGTEALFSTDAELLELGKEEADKISKKAQDTGTEYHSKIESIYKENRIEHLEDTRIKKFSNFLSSSTMLSSEEFVYYIDKDNTGYAGTLDAVLEVNLPMFNKQDDLIVDKNSKLIVDWKFTNKAKYPKSMGNNGYYYPLIGYALQLSAYHKAYAENQNIDGALLVVVPETGRLVYYYYYDKNTLNYYSDYFMSALKSPNTFNWCRFCEESNRSNQLGERLYL